MEGCGSNKYTQSEFSALFASILDGTYNDYINSWFDPVTANTLLRGISLDPTNPNAGLKNIDDILDFLYSLDPEEEVNPETREGNDPKYSTEYDTVDLTPRADFTESGGTVVEYDETIGEFKTQIVERTLLKDGQLIDPDTVSENLFDYRLELLQKLYNFVAPGKELPELTSPESFTRFTNTLLSLVLEKKKQKPEEFKNYRGDYIILKNFDHLLEDEIDYITVKSEYRKSNLLWKDMYESTGPFNYKDRFASFSETAGTEDYTSSFVKLLLWYFKVDGRPIGLDGFQAISGEILEMVETPDEGQLNQLMQRALYEGIEDSLTDENGGIKYLFESFIKNPAVKPTSKKIAQAIYDNIFSTKSPLDNKIKKIFLNQFITSVRYAYLAYRLKYDSDVKEMRFVSELLQSELINKQTYNVQRAIKARVYALMHNPEMLQELLDKYDIEITRNSVSINASGNSKVNLYRNTDYANEAYAFNVLLDEEESTTYSISSKSRNVHSKLLSKDFIKEFIEDITGLSLPDDFTDIYTISNPNGNMWDDLARIAIIVLTATAKTDDGSKLYDRYQYLYRNEELKLSGYFKVFEPLGNFFSVVYGTDYNTVIKNAEGNNLPTSQLRTSVFDVKREIYSIHNRAFKQRSSLRPNTINENGEVVPTNPTWGQHVFGRNYLYQHPEIIGTTAMRSDTKLDNQSRVAQQLLPAEVLHEAIDVDFYASLTSTSKNEGNALHKTRYNQGKRKATDVSIWIQPIVYSDKRTHFVIEFRVNKLLIKGEKFSDLLKTVATFEKSRTKAIEKIENELRAIRLDKYEKQAISLISRFSTALKWDLKRNESESIRDYFDRAKARLHEFYLVHGKNTAAELEKHFGTEADIFNQADISVADSGEVFFNPTLDNQISTYSDKSRFDTRIKANKINFVRTLIDAGYSLDPAYNPNWRSTFKKLQTEENSEWFDDFDGSMKLFIAKDAEGKVVEIDWTNMNDIDWNSIDFQLNPILESYYYADVFLSSQYTDILFGDVNGYNAKHKTYKLKDGTSLLNEMFLIEDESARLADMAKRTVNAGASRITFTQGLKYGIDSKALIANVRDLLGPAFNFTGVIDNKFKTQDGSTYCHPVFARLQNFSLLDRRVGNQRKKTFGNGIDPETGIAWELKHAEYTLTNEYRRIGCEHTDYSYELMYKKTSSLKSDKFGKVDISKYYGKEVHRNSDGENVTCMTDIYRWNPNTMLYEKLESVEQNGPNVVAHWQPYNDDHSKIEGAEYTEDFYLDDLYALDQLFGGAYCAVWNNNANRFEFSEINQDLLAVIVCEEGLKTNFISLVSNESATKVGVRNLNNSDIFRRDNNTSLKYWEFSTLCYGIQMNPDHDIEDEHGVREMSQMISALIQGGMLSGKVNEIYRMIGEVALDSVRTTINAVEEGDQDTIYEIVGNALVKAFDTNQKDVLGLAQSFVSIANRDLANRSFNTRIPFSANTIKGSFQATITSFLNKDAIRRRYSGMGGINTPSNGGIQYFQWNGANLNWVEFLKAVGGKINADNLLTNLHWNGTQFDNPTIVPIDKSDVKFGDTIVYRNEFGVPVDKKIDSPAVLYDYKYHTNYGQLYNWTVKPKDLSSSNIEFIVGGKTFSIWDTDLVRIVNESMEITEHPEYFYTAQRITDENNNTYEDIILTDRGIQFYNLLRNAFPERTITVQDITNTDSISDYFAQAKWDISNKLLPSLSKASTEQVMIPIQESMKLPVHSIEEWDEDWIQNWRDDNRQIAIDSVKFQALQVGIGKRNSKKLGLQPGTTLNEVRNQKDKYFKKQLRKLALRPATVDPELYDAVLYSKDGTPTLVMVGSLEENAARFSQLHDNPNYKELGKHYWKNGVDYGESTNKVFKTYIDDNGKQFDVVIVSSWKDFNDLYHNGLYANAVYNYTTENWDSIVKFRFKNNFDKQGFLIKSLFDINGRPAVEQTPEGDLYSVDDEDMLILELNNNESRRQTNFINRRARQMYEAFEMQLKVIVDRIPSQSMQSFLSADVAMLFDTEENLMVMSYFLLWLQGADLDVDKSFTITYEVGDDGRIVTPSKLDRYYSAEKIFDLPLPSKKKFIFYNDTDYAAKVLAGEIENDAVRIDGTNLTRQIPIELLNIILMGSGKVVFNDNVDPEIRNRIEELIQLHQSSVNLPSTQKVVGYKNKIVHIIHQVLRDPIVQAQTNVPVDEAMDELKSAIPTPSYKVEFFRTWDNPAAKFAIQRDNMVGRDVIGISAVSLKAFFAESAYGNSVITDILNLVQAYNNEFRITGKYNTNIGNQIVNLLKKICFDAKFTKDPNVPTGIATIANLRFIELLNTITPQVSTIRYTTSLTTPRLTVLNNYRVVEDGVNALNIAALVSDLNVYANGTYKNPKNAALVLSGYTSLATDNAKELQLVKMNATSKFADIHTYLTSIGIPPKPIIEFMASPAFNLIARFAETSILDPNTRRFSVRNALAFVQDQSCLPVMRDDMFRTVLACEIKNKSFLDLLSTDQLFIIAEHIDPNVKRVYPDRTEIKSVVTSALRDSNLRKKAVDAIYSLLRQDSAAEKLLLKAIQGGIKNSTSRNRAETVDEDIILENQYSEEDFIDESDLENDSYYDQNEFFVNWELKKEDWIEAYRYVKNYLIPKNRALRKLTGDYNAQYARLSTILDAIEEQQMLGALCGINQGLDTNDFDEYKRIRRIEKYINKKYREYVTANEGAKMDRFNFITFLNDPEERRHQIEQYEKVAATYNILDIITSIPHYNAMSKLIATNRYLIQRSVALKMERDLAEAVITADKPNEGGFNYGDTQQLTEKEWSILRNYVNDLLILKWFENQPNLTITLPTGKYFYSRGKEQINSVKDLNGKTQPVISSIRLNTLDGLASFKRLMDTSIIPELKRAFPDNVFLKDLIIGSTHNKMLDRLQTFYCPSFDLTEVDKNGSLRSKYEAISRAFNEIAKQQLPKELSKYNTKDVTWNIGDLFFLYNLLVHKDSFASRSFTKLFEDSNVLNDFIGRQYYKYLSELDSRKINYQELFKDELFPNAEARTKEQANNYLIDLRVRLAESENAGYKFKVTSTGIGSDYQIQILNSDGETRDLKFWDPDVNPSDYTLWFPYKLSKSVNRVKPAVDERIAIKSTVLENTTFEGVSSLVISALVKRLQEMLGRNIKINFITTNELNDMWTTGKGEIKFVNEEDYLRTRDASAFVYNGNIYINDKNLSIDKPVHEFLHIITAAMKYSGDKSIKQMYYNLLDAVASDPENQQHYANLRAIYSGRRDSDIKEELLVEVLANRFAAQFAEGWENERTQTTEVLKQGHVIEYTINTLNTLFGSTIPEDIEAVTLGNTDLRTLLSIFGSTITNVDKLSLANTIIPTDTRVRAIKQALINKKGDNNITFNGDCI